MVVIEPSGVPVLGNINVLWVSAIASNTLAPTVAELTASSPTALDISGYLLAEAWEPGQDVSKNASPRRLSQRSTFERITTTNLTLADLQYVFDPQGATGADAVKAMEVLTEGLSGFFVERQGKDRNAAIAAGQFVNVIPVTLGPQMPMSPSDDGADFIVNQPVSVRAARKNRLAVLA